MDHSDLYVQNHPVMGWVGKPNYEGFVPGYPNTEIFLDPNGWRRGRERIVSNVGRRINIYGCSYLFGVGIPFESTFLHLLQQSMDDVIIEGHGLPGYSTTQCFLHLQRDLRSLEAPDLSIFCFLDVHLRRNVASPIFLRNIHGKYPSEGAKGFFVPRAGLDCNGKLRITQMKTFDSSLSKQDIPLYEIDFFYAKLVMLEIVREAAKDVEKFGKELIVVVLRKDLLSDREKNMFVEVEKIVPCHDISEPRGSSYDLSATNFHPNIDGHSLFAKAIGDVLKSMKHF